ncbi:TPA: DUF1024 family protein [Staphylococcus aureus]|nr:DUF1024 family protein [Staphylococcus aureus]AUU69351.1 DUF1024 domain-containing protein [Staphylococcus aureus]MBY0959447.1 DUF1024 family protein [Staphylococcus aureus]QBZ86304.1 DUF1024 family protein [Staphylococcus aureus]TBV42171.1 DUF1024 family protein [Staphylococcus aureus]
MARKARIVTINDKPYRFTKSEMELIESHGITAGMVSKRVKDGWELHEAVGIMTGQVVYKYEEEQENEKI